MYFEVFMEAVQYLKIVCIVDFSSDMPMFSV